MCGGGGSSQPKAPAPPPVQYYPEGARTQQQVAAANAGTGDQGAFGSELAATANAAPTAKTSGAM
jgi:hypothetical protein